MILNYQKSLIPIFGMLFLINIYRSIHCGQDTGCVDLYWANFFGITWHDGFTRRAFIGTVVDIFQRNSVDAFLVNILSIFLAINLLVIASIRVMSFGALAFVLFIISPATSTLFEVLGDPLHLVILLLLLCSYYESKILISLAFFFSILIHEASIFIFAPIFLARVFALKSFLVIASVTLLIALLFSFLTIGEQPSVSSKFLVSLSGEDIKIVNVLPSFFQLLLVELRNYFGSLGGVIFLIYKIVASNIFPIFFLFVISIYRRNVGERALKNFCFLLACASPLYLIAHDWGRFSVYILLLSLFFVKLDLSLIFLSPIIDRVIVLMVNNKFLTIAVTAACISWDTYRINGITPENLVFIMIFVVLIFILKKNYAEE